jgi:hypothetical protein
LSGSPHPMRVKVLARLRAARAVDLPSALIALTLTVAAFASVFVVSARTLLFQSASVQIERPAPHETLVFLEATGSAPRIEQPVQLRSPLIATARPAAASARVRDVDTGSTPAPATSSKPSTLAGPDPTFLPRFRPQPRSSPSPFELPRARNPFVPDAQWTRAQIDSTLEEMRHAVPNLAATRTATAAERDSLMREQARERTIPGRAPQMPGGVGGSIGVHLFSAGPSAAERRRDSSANAEYVARLRRLQARASASRESLRVADSMSRVRTP